MPGFVSSLLAGATLPAFLISGCGVANLIGQGFPPEEAPRHMTVIDGLSVNLVASEPTIVQPVCIEFDPRGRLWVIQYLQYPNPAGLKRARVDRWSRTIYDRVPEPPPRGPKGADRITVFDGIDAQGRATGAHDFLSGLNLASGIAFGHGGVFVLNVPYLLFYPDRNGDDVPDGDPEVCLSGFGMEDAHSVANSLTWGPDGWLYGCQGSTVTAHIRGIEFQQGVWRYHPLTREFELFCEGGGNSWGLDFDEDGEIIYSTNYGGYRGLHGVQGAYLWKSIGKHGALHNPYAFGYFDHIPNTNFTGGHVTVGGIVYQGTNLPPRFHHQYLCGDLLGHGVQWHNLFRQGSTFTSSHGGYLLAANDTWFASSDLTMAPDGSVYVADWFDKRTAHPDPDADWDRSNGRVYRLSATGAKPIVIPDFKHLASHELVGLLGNPNVWIVREARQALAERRDPSVISPLRRQIADSSNDHLALESLWALQVSGGFNEDFARGLLSHHAPAVRKWTVRLLGDAKIISTETALKLALLAATEPDVSVRAQLAATAKRLPPGSGLPIVQALVRRDNDRNDTHLPLLLWWAVEQHAVSALTAVESFFISAGAWNSSLGADFIDERLMRRWIAEGTTECQDAAARLLQSAPDNEAQFRLIAALEQGFHDRPSGVPAFGSGGLFAHSEPAELRLANPGASKQTSFSPLLLSQFRRLWSRETTNAALIRIGARTGDPAAHQRAIELLRAGTAPATLRIDLVRLVGELADSADAPVLLEILGTGSEILQLAALDSLQAFAATEFLPALLSRYSALTDRVRARAREVMLSRKAGAKALLVEVEGGRIEAKEFGTEQLRVVALHDDPTLDLLVKKHWGNISGGTPEEKLAEMRRFNNDLNAAKGNLANGREIFGRTCAPCHTLFGQGGKVGPDLTFANRSDREYLLASIVDPSAVVRKEFLAYEVETDDGRILTGLIAEQSGSQLTLVPAGGERVTIPQSKVTSLRESSRSLMPDGLLSPLKPQEIRDLFAYLQRPNSTP